MVIDGDTLRHLHIRIFSPGIRNAIKNNTIRSNTGLYVLFIAVISNNVIMKPKQRFNVSK